MGYHRDDTFLKLLGERIRELRKSKDLTQADMAHEMELPTSQIGRIERGESNFSVSYLPELAKTLGVLPGELLHFTEG